MRVAYVCADPGVPVWGTKGASAHVRAVVRALRHRGASVTIFAARLGGTAPRDLDDVVVVELPTTQVSEPAARERFAVDANSTLSAALEAHSPFDVVYERYSLWSTAGMAYAATRPDVVGVLEVNAPLIEEQERHRSLHDRRGALSCARRAMRDADAVIAVSEPVAAWTSTHGARATVIPNGVDVHRFSPAVPEPGTPFTIAFVGSLKPWHGTELLVDAVRRVVDRGVDARVLVVGDGPERATLDEAVAAARLSERVTFTGAVDPDDVPATLGCAHVGAAPYPAATDHYFSPLKVLDYLGAGLPVVGSSVGQIPDLVDHGAAGILCPPGDVEAFTDALFLLATDDRRRARLATAARELAVARHSWDAVVARTLVAAGVDAVPEGAA